jgi:hypothetical protein
LVSFFIAGFIAKLAGAPAGFTERGYSRRRMVDRRPRAGSLVFLLASTVASGCSSGRGPVDRSVDAAHATNRTIGESADDVTNSAGNIVVDAVTFPFRLVVRVFSALFS